MEDSCATEEFMLDPMEQRHLTESRGHLGWREWNDLNDPGKSLLELFGGVN